MRELRRTFNTINDDITKSKKVGELTYDSKNIDILIKTEDGHDSLYNKFYAENRILTEQDESKKQTWLFITNLTYKVNKLLLDTLAIDVPDRM